VADWAGHSVEMLLGVYAKCLDGQDEIAKGHITAALGRDWIRRRRCRACCHAEGRTLQARMAIQWSVYPPPRI